MYDAIIIGAGHNGLVAACYLAMAGHKVLVLERRHLVGGATVTEEIVPGFKFSRLSYVNSLFRPEIIRELKLRDYGFSLLPRNPSSFTPFPDGRHLFLGPDEAETCREIAKFSTADAEAYVWYEKMLERMVSVIEPTLDRPPVDVLGLGPRNLIDMARLAWRARKLGPDIYRFFKMMTGSARELLDEWFESEELKTTLATDAIIGAMASPSLPGTAYILFHHVMGETDGARGVWAYVRGGMGALAESIAGAAKDLGVEIRTECPVAKITVDRGRASGVVTESGEEIASRVVVSNADPNITFKRLLGKGDLPCDFVRQVDAIDYSSATFKLNLALSEVPSFTTLPSHGPGPQHRGTIHISPTMRTIETAYDDARRGVPSRVPILECTIPSVLDDTLAPEGKHVMSMFVQYAPYELESGDWDQEKEAFADRCIDLLEQYAPGFKQSVIARDALSPLDLEREFSLTGGNIFHGAMTTGQMYFMRPVSGFSDYTTPIEGLYLCGAGTHPGGGVIGACGRNAARQVIKRQG